MNEHAVLGFAVPVYRRPQLLDLALRSIVAQAQQFSAPIYIPDNSCDNTNVEVVRRWQSAYPNITHERNEENIGIDRNVDRAITRCPAEYVHVIGDDDIILPGFAERAIEIIRRKRPAHLVCSYMYLSNDYEPISRKPILPASAPAGSLRQLLPTYGWTLGFIGAHVFQRARFMHGGVDGFGTYFHHLMRLVTAIGPDEPLAFLDTPLVGNRADDESTATWSGDRLAVVFGRERTLAAAMKDSYSPTEVQRMIESARANLGYAEFFRLLYWAALAERAGRGPAYWESLSRFVPSQRYAHLYAVPDIVKAALFRTIPTIRRMKRRLTAAV
jgi:glycosyltransferase involved in cell wall biosynthesis